MPLGSGGGHTCQLDEAIRLQREKPTVVGMPLAIIVSLEKQGTSTSRFINTVLGAANQRPMWSVVQAGKSTCGGSVITLSHDNRKGLAERSGPEMAPN